MRGHSEPRPSSTTTAHRTSPPQVPRFTSAVVRPHCFGPAPHNRRDGGQEVGEVGLAAPAVDGEVAVIGATQELGAKVMFSAREQLAPGAGRSVGRFEILPHLGRTR